MESRRRRSRSGQTLIEYLVLTVMILASVAILSVFLFTFREQGDRVLQLVGYEYP